MVAAADVTSFALRAYGPGGPALLYTTRKVGGGSGERGFGKGTCICKNETEACQDREGGWCDFKEHKKEKRVCVCVCVRVCLWC